MILVLAEDEKGLWEKCCFWGGVHRLKEYSALDETGGMPMVTGMQSFLFPRPPLVAVDLHNINRSIKASQFLSAFISVIAMSSFIL